jgi:DNA repair ATPase RecN
VETVGATLLPTPPRGAIGSFRTALRRAEGRRDEIARRLHAVKAEVSTLEAEEELLRLVGDLFRTLIDAEVTENVRAVERLLTEALQTVFTDMDVRVRADVETQRGKVSVDLVTVEVHPDGTETEGSSTEGYGGSISTVQSVLLRIIVVLRREMRPLLLLDESLGAVAEEYVPKLGRFLSLLSQRLGIDVLAVTHNPTLVEAAHKGYRINKPGTVATFKEIR